MYLFLRIINGDEILTFHAPIFFLHFWCRIGAALAVLRGYIAALLVGGILVLQDVFDAEFQAIQARLRAWSLGEGAGLGLLRTSCLGHSAPT